MRRAVFLTCAALSKQSLTSSGLNRNFATGTAADTDTEVLVIGAGVIGLAIARQLALVGRSVLLCDAASRAGTETSSRNSEVIHAGIYYPKGSLKAQLCVQGKQLMYDYCSQRDIPHRRLGKLLVATTEAQLPALQSLQRSAAMNGVHDLQSLTSQQVKALEPHLSCISGVLSPSTGIVDSHSLMSALLEDFEAAEGTMSFNSKVESVIVGRKNGKITTLVRDVGGGEAISISSRYLINAAGLHAQNVASTLKGLPKESIPELFLAKGNYFVFLPPSSPDTSSLPTTAGSSQVAAAKTTPKFRFNHLIYPIPEPGTAGLGVHLTVDLAGGLRFGPDVEYLPPGTNPEKINYSVDPGRGPLFEAAARRYFPDLPENSLVPGYSGVRPKIVPPGQPAGDFVVSGPSTHGVAGVVNLYGIESPGLTSSLALAHLVERELKT